MESLQAAQASAAAALAARGAELRAFADLLASAAAARAPPDLAAAPREVLTTGSAACVLAALLLAPGPRRALLATLDTAVASVLLVLLVVALLSLPLGECTPRAGKRALVAGRGVCRSARACGCRASVPWWWRRRRRSAAPLTSPLRHPPASPHQARCTCPTAACCSSRRRCRSRTPSSPSCCRTCPRPRDAAAPRVLRRGSPTPTLEPQHSTPFLAAGRRTRRRGSGPRRPRPGPRSGRPQTNMQGPPQRPSPGQGPLDNPPAPAPALSIA
jgi:hypothetical protein